MARRKLFLICRESRKLFPMKKKSSGYFLLDLFESVFELWISFTRFRWTTTKLYRKIQMFVSAYVCVSFQPKRGQRQYRLGKPWRDVSAESSIHNCPLFPTMRIHPQTTATASEFHENSRLLNNSRRPRHGRRYRLGSKPPHRLGLFRKAESSADSRIQMNLRGFNLPM